MRLESIEMIITLIIIGDILVCAFLIGIVAYLFMAADEKKHDEAARLPLLDDAESLAGGRVDARE